MMHVLCNFIGIDIKGERYNGLNAAVNIFFSSLMNRVWLCKDAEWRKWASAPRIGNWVLAGRKHYAQYTYHLR